MSEREDMLALAERLENLDYRASYSGVALMEAERRTIIKALRGVAAAPLTLEDETVEDLQSDLAISLIMDAAWPDGHRAMARAILEKYDLIECGKLAEVLEFINSIEGAGYGGMASFEIARDHIRSAVTRPAPEAPAATPLSGKAEIASILRKHLTIGGHDAWEGHYYHVAGIDAAAEAVAVAVSRPKCGDSHD